MSKKLRAGVIGLGMGSNHLTGYLTHPDVEVIAIADRREDRRANIKSTHIGNYKIYNEGIDLINNEKLDIISVAVPNNQHKDLTIAALKSGANVLCEKPMAMDAIEAQEMCDTAKSLGLKLGINFSYRFGVQSQAMKAIVDEGSLGNIYYARSAWFRRFGIPGLAAGAFGIGNSSMGSWFFDKEQSGGGPLIDLGVHRLDFALWLMGYPEPEWVMGSTYNARGVEAAKNVGLNYTVEDLACAMIKFKNGATLELDASWIAHVKEEEKMSTRLIGEKGGVFQYNLNEGYDYNVDYYYTKDGNSYNATFNKGKSFVSSYHWFANSVRDNTPFLVQPEEGVIVMKILDAIYKSAQSGEPIKIN